MILNENYQILGDQDGQKKMEALLGVKLRHSYEKNLEIMAEYLQSKNELAEDEPDDDDDKASKRKLGTSQP